MPMPMPMRTRLRRILEYEIAPPRPIRLLGLRLLGCLESPRRSRIRRLLKWMGAGVCVLLIVAGGASFRWTHTNYFRWKAGCAFLLLDSGVVSWNASVWMDSSLHAPPISAFRLGWKDRRRFPKRQSSLWLPTIRFSSRQINIGVDRKTTARYSYYALPLWIPILVLGGLSGRRFYLDRRLRIPPGHCKKCGYDLTGNVSGVCPECGTAIECHSGKKTLGSGPFNGDQKV